MAPAPAAPAAPAAAAVARPAFAAPAPPATPAALAPAAKAIQGDSSAADATTATLLGQQRIIIRTVDLNLVVQDVAASLDSIAALAVEMGGWFVGRDYRRHTGSISIRVPADQLDAAIMRLRGMAIEVKSEVVTSQDVTEEYFDTRARLDTLVAERDTLRTLFDNAKTVEEALKVREALVRVQGDIEVLQVRIDAIERTSAFSLIRVSLSSEPADMAVDAGPDQTSGVGETVRFRAYFKPPEGIEEFFFTWDFGDGSGTVSSGRTAPSDREGMEVTATITHAYRDERDSPFFAEVKMTGTGAAGLAEGEDTLVVTVTRLPSIEVFAGEGVTVDEGEEVEFSGSFTRPEGIRDVSFAWDFGDGSAKVSGDLGAGVTNAVARHAYDHHRPFPFTATLTITAQSDAGEVEASSSVSVRVREGRGWVIAGWSAGQQGKTAVRALSGIGQGIATLAIWLAIFSPVWIAAGLIGRFAWRRRGRRSMNRAALASAPPVREPDGPSVVCPSCGRENDESVRFCINCGHELTTTE